ncbi:MAG: hypothetical protein M1838_001713 [Thelocarpon superellum]|nr:MAG: hypothetical protein M1838_001713 [Thelocarpon superellum]
MEEMARRIEEDPFSALFGSRAERGRPSGPWSTQSIFNTWGWGTGAGLNSRVEMRSFSGRNREGEASEEPDQSHTPKATGRTGRDVEPDASERSTQAQASESTTSHDAEIDPITMRRVPRRTMAEHTIDIPVKIFTERRSASDRSGEFNEAEAEQSWLSQEKFDSGTSKPKLVERGPQAHGPGTKSSDPTSPGQAEAAPAQLKYDVTESTVEDLDLLRPSDVRANAGQLSTARQETAVERQERRKILEADFDRSSDPKVSHADEEAAHRNIQRLKSNKQDDSSDEASSRGLETASAREKADVTPVPSSTTDEFGYDVVPKGLETSYRSEMEMKVQGLEHSYIDELQARETARFEAEVDGYAKTPQGLQVSYESEMAATEAAAKASEVDGYSSVPQGLQTSYVEERNAQNSPSPGLSMGGEGDLSKNAVNFVNQSPLFTQIRRQVEKNERKTKERELVKEIQAIYEKNYGALSTKHRQPLPATSIPQHRSITAVEEGLAGYDGRLGAEGYQFDAGQDPLEEELKAQAQTFTQSEPLSTVKSTSVDQKATTTTSEEATTYKVLAFDPATREMTMAITSSSIAPESTESSDKVINTPEVLLRLNNPAPFLPHFVTLQAEGYEIASGGGDVLVFKKVRDATPAPPAADIPRTTSTVPACERKRPPYHIVNPIDGTTIGNFASPTGFVNHNAVLPESLMEDADPPPSMSSSSPSHTGRGGRGKVMRREEAVFSGRKGMPYQTQGEQEGESEPGPKRPFRRTVRRLFWVGAWVAGCSYAVGVATEFLRSGAT